MSNKIKEIKRKNRSGGNKRFEKIMRLKEKREKAASKGCSKMYIKNAPRSRQLIFALAINSQMV